MPKLYVAKNPKYSSVSRNKPHIKDCWIIKEFIVLDCSEETYKADYVIVDRKNKKAYSDIKDVFNEYKYDIPYGSIYSVTPDDYYYDPSMG